MNTRTSNILAAISALAVAFVVIGIVAFATAEDGKSLSPSEAKTVTMTAQPKVQEVTPQACLDAISYAEDFAGTAAQFIKASAEYPPLVAKAYQAGYSNDYALAQSVITKMRSINRDMKAARQATSPLVQQFNEAKAQCRESAS